MKTKEREIADDDIHENNETLIKVDLSNTKISISQDMPLYIENDMISETLIHSKNALIATIDELKCTIKFLKNELEGKKTYTFVHYYYGMPTNVFTWKI